MKIIYSQVCWLRIGLLAGMTALCLLFVTAAVTSAHTVSARQVLYVSEQLAPDQILRGGGGGGHGGGGHSSSSHSSSSHSTSSHDSSSDSSSSSSSHYYSGSHTYHSYNGSSGSPLDWSTCLTLLVIGAIILIVVMAVRNRRN